MNWFYSGSSSKSIAELQSLVDDVILAPDFKISDLSDFNAKRELRRLDGEVETHLNNPPSTSFANENGWKQSSVYIKLPCEKVLQKEDTASILEVPGVYHRSLIEVITTALQDTATKTFHLVYTGNNRQKALPSAFTPKFITRTPLSKRTRRSRSFHRNLVINMSMPLLL